MVRTPGLVAVAVLAGCDGSLFGGTQIGFEEGSNCHAVAISLLSYEEVAPNGLSPMDVVGATEGTYTSTLDWGSAAEDPVSSTGVTMTLTYNSGAASFVDLEADAKPFGGSESAALCFDQVQVAFDAVLTTDDDQLAESFAVAIVGQEWTDPGRSAPFQEYAGVAPLDPLMGTLDPADYAEDLDGDGIDTVVSFHVVNGVSDGQIAAVGEHPNAPGEEDLVVGRWGPPGDASLAR